MYELRYKLPQKIVCSQYYDYTRPVDRETELVVQCSLVMHGLLCKLNKATRKDSLPLLKVDNLSDLHDCSQHLTSQVALLIVGPQHIAPSILLEVMQMACIPTLATWWYLSFEECHDALMIMLS